LAIRCPLGSVDSEQGKTNYEVNFDPHANLIGNQRSQLSKRDSVPLWGRLPQSAIVRLISFIVTIVISLSDVVDWLPKSRSSNNGDHNSPPNRANHIKSFLNTPGSNPYTRISFQLHNPNIVPYPAKFFSSPFYLCSGNNTMRLPHSLSQQAVLGFTTSISTDLNILFVGDSLSQQFVEAFDATLVPEGHESNRVPFFGFWIFWVLGSGNYFEFPRTPFFWRANFPEPSRISQNPKKASVSAQAQNTTRLRRVVSLTHTACLRKRRTQHDYVVLCRSRIQRVCASAEHNTRLRRVVSLALRGRIVYRQKHDYVVLSLTWRRRTTIGAIEFRIKNNLFI
jgi:hypothetical protein